MSYDLKALRRPSPFQPGTLTLWSNAYIAKNVIKKHLDGTVDCGSRKTATIHKTVEWLNQIKPDTKQILDVGCGTGLYAPLFCQHNIYYEGFDISPYQVAYAQQYNSVPQRTMFYVNDFRMWSSKKKYDLVLLLYGVYSFYARDERIKFLRKVRGNLQKSGYIIMEVFTEKHYENRKDSTDWKYVEDNGFWCEEPYLELNAFYKYTEKSLVLIQAGVLKQDLGIWNSWIQTFNLVELEIELLEAGFTKFEAFGSCYGDPFTVKSDVICICAQ